MVTPEFVETLARLIAESLASGVLDAKRRANREALQRAVEIGTPRIVIWLHRNVVPDLRPHDSIDPLGLLRATLDHFKRSVSSRAERLYFAGLEKNEPMPRTRQQEFLLMPTDNVQVFSSSLYYKLGTAIASKDFTVAEGSFPKAALEAQHVRGEALLIPPQLENPSSVSSVEKTHLIDLVLKQLDKMSDVDCDVLDCLIAEYIRRVRPTKGSVSIAVDKILEMRRLRKTVVGKGRRSGYRKSQRKAVLEVLERLRYLWIDVFEISVAGRSARKKSSSLPPAVMHARAFLLQRSQVQLGLLEESEKVTHIMFQPAPIFGLFLLGAARPIAILSAKAVTYNPRTQRWEKRLTRHLSWRWCLRANGLDYFAPYTVGELLEALKCKPNGRFPARTKDRFEKALNRLERDRVIAGYQYEDWLDDRMSGPGWLNEWIETRIVIEPPEHIVDAYRPSSQATGREMDELPERLREKRINNNLSRLTAAEQMQIRPGQLLLFEMGSKIPARERKACEKWVKDAS